MNLNLSIIIPCYNCEATIYSCLESIPGDVGIEIILVDDCSKDQTANLIRQYKREHPEKEIVLQHCDKNIGAGEARNIGLGLVSRDYLTFLDSDDQFSSGFLQHVKPAFDTGFDCLVFDANMVSLSGVSYLKMFYTENIAAGDVAQKEALVYTRPATWGKIYRTQVIRDHNIRFGRIQRNEDLVFTKTALCFCKTVRYLAERLYLYHNNPNSLMNNRTLLTEKNAMNAVGLVKPVMLENGFDLEFNSVYFLEIVYATTMTLLRMGKTPGQCREHFRKIDGEYNRKDPYRGRYMRKYRLSYQMFRMNLFFLFRFLFR